MGRAVSHIVRDGRSSHGRGSRPTLRLLASTDHDRRRRDPVRDRRGRPGRRPRPAPGPPARRHRLVRWGACPSSSSRPIPTARSRPRSLGSEAVHGSPAPPERVRPARWSAARSSRGRGPRHDRGPALAGPDDLGRARDDHLAHRGPRHGSPATLLRPAWQGEPGWPVLLPPRAPRRRCGPSARTPMPPDVVDAWPRSIPTRARRARRSRRRPRSSTTPSRTCRPTRARRTRRAATSTNGARTSSPTPASPAPLRATASPPRVRGRRDRSRPRRRGRARPAPAVADPGERDRGRARCRRRRAPTPASWPPTAPRRGARSRARPS